MRVVLGRYAKKCHEVRLMMFEKILPELAEFSSTKPGS
jgi:hypothetical protein